MIWNAIDRNAESQSTQSFDPSMSSALSASPRFKISPPEHSYALRPGRYVGSNDVEDDDMFFWLSRKVVGTHPIITTLHAMLRPKLISVKLSIAKAGELAEDSRA